MDAMWILEEAIYDGTKNAKMMKQRFLVKDSS